VALRALLLTGPPLPIRQICIFIPLTTCAFLLCDLNVCRCLRNKAAVVIHGGQSRLDKKYATRSPTELINLLPAAMRLVGADVSRQLLSRSLFPAPRVVSVKSSFEHHLFITELFRQAD
jgi:hypothetical protein